MTARPERVMRVFHVLAGIVAYAGALACVLGADRLVPGFADWQVAVAASRLAALRGVLVPALLLAAAGTALTFPTALKRALSPRVAGEHVMTETVWHSIGYLCGVLGVMLVALLLETS